MHDDIPIWEAWTDAGHSDCGSWYQDPGKPVTCACGAVIITVTAEDIRPAKRHPARNPVALAAAASLGAEHVVAGADTLYLNLDGWRYEYSLPPDVRYLLAAYYGGEPVTPFSFALGEPVFSYVFRPRSTASRARNIPAAGRAA